MEYGKLLGWCVVLLSAFAASSCAIDDRDVVAEPSDAPADGGPADAGPDATAGPDGSGRDGTIIARETGRVEPAGPEDGSLARDANVSDATAAEAPRDARTVDGADTNARRDAAVESGLLDAANDRSVGRDAVAEAAPDGSVGRDATTDAVRDTSSTVPADARIEAEAGGFDARAADAAREASPCGTVCPPPVSGQGTGVCVGSSCALQCANGLTPCSSSCVNLMSDPAHCGACNDPCPTAAGGTPTCTAGACGISCANARLSCAGSCCPAPLPNQVATCMNDLCGSGCAKIGSRLACAGLATGQLACGSWTFESNTAEGWSYDPVTTGNAADGPAYLAPAPGTGSGTRSLAINAAFSSARREVRIEGNVCPNGMAAERDFMAFQVRVWFQPAPGAPALTGGSGSISLSNGPDPAGQMTFGALQPNTWLDWYVELSSFSVTRVSISAALPSGWSGTIYFDNLNLEAFIL